MGQVTPDYNWLLDGPHRYELFQVENGVVVAGDTPVTRKLLGMSIGAVKTICKRGIIWKCWARPIAFYHQPPAGLVAKRTSGPVVQVAPRPFSVS
jgi:hypothetical protein